MLIKVLGVDKASLKISLIYHRCLKSVYRTVYHGMSLSHETIKFDISPPGQNGRHFADVIFRRIFGNENFCILIKIPLKFVPNGPIDNAPPLV